MMLLEPSVKKRVVRLPVRVMMPPPSRVTGTLMVLGVVMTIVAGPPQSKVTTPPPLVAMAELNALSSQVPGPLPTTPPAGDAEGAALTGPARSEEHTSE